MSEFPPKPKFLANALKAEFIIHSESDFIAIAHNWAMGTGQIPKDKILNEQESPFASLRTLKHQARNAFKSDAFEHNEYVKKAQNAIRQVKEIMAPETGRNIYAYQKNPELYWHYGILAYYIGDLEEAKNILENKVVPAFMYDAKRIESADNTIKIINETLELERKLALNNTQKIPLEDIVVNLK